jgi:predicted DCC family thiol-disulfide oxidoreductase YuxK
MIDKEKLVKLSHAHPIVIFDGECMLCNDAIQYIIKHDATRVCRFLTLQTARTHQLIDADIAPDSIILMKDGSVTYESDAVSLILRKLDRWSKFLGYAMLVCPRSFRNVVYRWVARNRYQWFGKLDVCMMPPLEWKDIFLG